MIEILKGLYAELENSFANTNKKNSEDDLLTCLLLNKTTKKNVLNIFEDSAVYKYVLIENFKNVEDLKCLEEMNLISKIRKNTFDKYFINLNGILYIIGAHNFDVEKFIRKKNEELFPSDVTQIKINDEERLLIVLLILMGATSSEFGLQTIDVDENSFLFEFINEIYKILNSSEIFSFNSSNFNINWKNKKNQNFETFKTNVDSTTMYGLIKAEKNIRNGSNWYVDLQNEYFINSLFLQNDNKLEVYKEVQLFINILFDLKRKLDLNYYFKELPPLSEDLLKQFKVFSES
jgi:hypothetical protein